VERPLRRPAHFRRAVGETVTVKTRTPEGTARRVRGALLDADDDEHGGFTLELDGAVERFDYAAVEGARTVFEWGPAPKPGRAGNNRNRPRRARAAEERQTR
jgi:ribosome maturation factor RimP